MANLKTKINELTDFEVVRFFEHFNRTLFINAKIDGSQITSLELLKANIPESTREIEGFAEIENLSGARAKQMLEPNTSAILARQMLLALAEDQTFAPLIETALDTYRDDEMVADAVLAVGIAASLILIAATTELEGEILGIKFKKGQADSKLIAAMLKPFAEIITAIKG